MPDLSPFKIIGVTHAPVGVATVPFGYVAQFRETIERNHGQTLERINERGGLDWVELCCGQRGNPLREAHNMNPYEAASAVLAGLSIWLKVEGELYVTARQKPR